MKDLQWGVISTAKIGIEKVIPALQQSQLGRVTGIASRSQERAQAVAEELGIPKAYGSYQKLLDDSEIDAVYNPLPNHLHVPWTIKALDANKHVLCEKPIGLSTKQTQQLRKAAADHPQLKVMEAFMYRFHPQWKKVRQLVADGAIGQIKTINSFFSYFNDDPDDICNKPKMGGGGLMDIGCYNISLSRFIFDAEPKRVMAHIQYDPVFGVDRLASAIMEFKTGTATFTCATQIAPDQGVNIYGTGGHISLDIPFNAPANTSVSIAFSADGAQKTIIMEPCDQYTLQGDSFARAVLNDTNMPYSLDDASQNMAVIEATFESAEKNRWISID